MKERVRKRRNSRLIREIAKLRGRLKDTHGMPGTIYGLFTSEMDEERPVYLHFFTTLRTRRRLAKRSHASAS